MRSILWLIAVVCIFVWTLVFFGFIAGIGANSPIHVLLVIAIIALLYNILSGRKLV